MEKFLKAIKKIIAFIKKFWKWILGGLSVISGIIMYILFKESFKKPIDYVNNNDGTIDVIDHESKTVTTIETPVNNPDSAQLPNKIKNDKETEINHETVDRKNPDSKPIDDSAYNKLRRK